MKKKQILYRFCLILISSLLLNVHAAAVSDSRSFSWYCVRKKEHKQPIADADMQWIEEYDGHYIDHLHHDTEDEKIVYLTFDAGYENGNVAKTLDILKEENVSGAFFILGHLIQKNPDLVRRMAKEGHLVCNHTNRHPDMTLIGNFTDFEKELTDLEALYRETVGEEIARYFRPPEGKFDRTSMQYVKQMGYQTVFWSLAYADWDNANQPKIEQAKSILLNHVHNGAVILLHPTSQTNTLILQEFIQTLKQQGYRFGTLDELVANNQIARS